MLNAIFRATVLSCLLLVSLSGCESLATNQKPTPPVADVIGTSHAAADALIDSAGAMLYPQKPLIAATFVNIDDLDQAASFGRVVSEQIASRFTQRSFNVVEMLLRHSIFIRQKQGEFLLSREVRNLSSEHDAQAVIVGTYAIGSREVYITARLVRAADSIVLASHDYTLPCDRNVSSLLSSGRERLCQWK